MCTNKLEYESSIFFWKRGVYELLVYVIAQFAVVFGNNSTSNAEIIVRGKAEYNLLRYECY